MVNYGFVIDNRRCIGCHACSTACKSENEVPLGVYRTWVKYVEKGEFPQTRRHFQVTRCNHCANPPCVRICPVTAMYQRTDGIVDFDPRLCIGCKACLQACPYDAIHIDPQSGTAAKCHYCAHRTEIGLEPACVVVCPADAIISGDLDDSESEIRRLRDRHNVSVRKPEQGTAPNLYYIEGDDVTLQPLAASVRDEFNTVDLATDQVRAMAGAARGTSEGRNESGTSHSGHAIREPGEQGAGSSWGPIRIEDGRMAGQMVQTVYNAQHRIPWHWQVPAYLVTKAIGSGLFFVLALFGLLTPGLYDTGFGLLAGAVSLAFIGITTGLLVFDLERPERFFTILIRPQWGSWLTRGAWILVGFSGLVGAWWGLEALFGPSGRGPSGTGIVWIVSGVVRPAVFIVGGVLAILSAVYTAFLFGQAEGRDLWQSTLLPVQFFVRAVMVGAGAIFALALFTDPLPELWSRGMAWLFLLSATAHLGLLGSEYAMPHASHIAVRAADAICRGPYRLHFWLGGVLLSGVVPFFLLSIPLIGGFAPAGFGTLAFLSATAGLFAYEYAFILAPQEIPNA